MRSVRRFLGLLVAATLLVTGCGDDDDQVAADTAGSTAATTADDADAPDEGGGTQGTDGDGSDGDGGGVIGDGCDIVTEADAEEMLEEPVTQAEADASPTDQFALASCNWEVDTDTSFKLLQFTIWEGAQFYGADEFQGEESFEAVDGLGDGAYLLDVMGQSLTILDGDRTISLDISTFNIDDPAFDDSIEDKLVELGERVLERT